MARGAVDRLLPEPWANAVAGSGNKTVAQTSRTTESFAGMVVSPKMRRGSKNRDFGLFTMGNARSTVHNPESKIVAAQPTTASPATAEATGEPPLPGAGNGGRITWGTKATAFVGTDDRFYVVTTARSP